MGAKNDERVKGRVGWVPFVSAGAAVVLAGGSICLAYWLFPGTRSVSAQAARGTFGDMFGAANAVISGVALLLVAYTVMLQRTELQLQRDELVESRKEVRRSADAQQLTAAHLESQLQESRTDAKLRALASLMTEMPEFCTGAHRDMERRYQAHNNARGDKSLEQEFLRAKAATEATLEHFARVREEFFGLAGEVTGVGDVEVGPAGGA
jgi:hypothetical protein